MLIFFIESLCGSILFCTFVPKFIIFDKTMEQNVKKQFSVAYDLFSLEEDGRHLIERATAETPFEFISGCGVALEAFEEQLQPLKSGDTFDFTLTPEQAYGAYLEESVLELDREMFVVDGQFDRQHIYVDAVIPLQNGTGDRFLGRVLEIRSDVVVVDLNHPLAGKTLNFRGTVVHSHEASEAEIQQVIRQLASGACGGCCGGDCDDENCGNGGCGGCGK